MQAEDAELEQFRTGVNCAALLEGWSPSWRLDRKESTHRALKYRREEGEVLIVNHDGRGWWDPQNTAKGDIFDLVQCLDPNLNFGQVRRELRRFVGVVPTFPQALSGRAKNHPRVPIAARWMTRPRLRRASAVWNYLAGARRLPASVLEAADGADILAGMRGRAQGSGATRDPPHTPMAGRLAAFERQMQESAGERALQRAERSGRTALNALDAFRSGEGATVMNRIREAARSEPGGMAAVLSEMRVGGRFADLRQQFNNALETERGVTAAYDKASAALARYGQQRVGIEQVIARRPDAANLSAKFEQMDAQIGEAAAATPSRRDGKSMVDDLAQKAAELLQRAVDAVRSTFGRSQSAEAASRAAPAPAMTP